MLMTPDGKLHPGLDKSKLIHGLEDLANNMQDDTPDDSNPSTEDIHENTCIVFDAMAVVQELVSSA